MRPAAVSIAVLLGIATLGAPEARATPALSATIVVESGHTVHIGGKRHHHHFHRGFKQHRHKHVARHHKGWHHKGWHHKGWHHGRHHRPAFVGKRFHKAPVVIVRPMHGRWFAHRHLPARPLIRNGSFARGPHRWW